MVNVAVPSSTTYTSSWPEPASSCSLISVPSSPSVTALIPNEWIPRCSRTGMNLPRRSRSSRRATRHFALSFIRSPPSPLPVVDRTGRRGPGSSEGTLRWFAAGDAPASGRRPRQNVHSARAGGRLRSTPRLEAEQRAQVALHVVEVRFQAVVLRHVVAAGLVAERETPRQRRHAVSLVQIHRLDGLRIRPPVEQPRLDGPSRRLDLQVGATERHLGSVLRHHHEVVAPSDAQVDGANRHVLPERSEC